jgi:uncharacterized metal-binding protein YceD (DUF177 family)
VNFSLLFAYHKKNSTFARQFSKQRKVDHLKDFKIKFRGLSVGVHHYNWEIDKKFFDAFENAELNDASLTTELELEKQERMMILNFAIGGEVTVPCDRCLEDLIFPVEIKEAYYIKFGTERLEESEDVLVIPESEHQIDVSILINEYITLSLPLRRVHEPDENGKNGCNEELLKKLEELSGKKGTDPRWEQLKNIKLD